MEITVFRFADLETETKDPLEQEDMIVRNATSAEIDADEDAILEQLGFYEWSIDRQYVEDLTRSRPLSKAEMLDLFEILCEYDQFDRQGIVWDALKILRSRRGEQFHGFAERR